jgi:hypothetical protein
MHHSWRAADISWSRRHPLVPLAPPVKTAGQFPGSVPPQQANNRNHQDTNQGAQAHLLVLVPLAAPTSSGSMGQDAPRLHGPARHHRECADLAWRRAMHWSLLDERDDRIDAAPYTVKATHQSIQPWKLPPQEHESAAAPDARCLAIPRIPMYSGRPRC